METESRICRRCGGDFIARDKRQFFCSKTCALKACDERRPTLGTLACAHCGKDFKLRRASQTFCSLECKRRAQGVKPREARAQIACRQCGTAFTPIRADAKFCSTACAQQAEYAMRRVKNAAKLKTITCPGCKTEFQQRRKDQRYCSAECYSRNYKADPAATTAPKVLPKDDASILRILGDNFYLPHLADELAALRKTPGARAALENKLRAAIIGNPIWPSHSLAGQCALILWLLANPAAEVGRFSHLFNRPKPQGAP